MIPINRLVGNISGSLALKGAAIVVGLLSVPAYINYFSNQQLLGVWFSIISVMNWMLFLDFGLGNGIKNEVTFRIAKGKAAEARGIIWGGYLWSAILSLLLATLLLAAAYFLRFSEVSADIASIDFPSIEKVLLIVVATFALQFPLRMSVSILYGLQMSALAAAVPVVTNTLVLVYLLMAGSSGIGDPVLLVQFYAIAVIAPLLGAAAVVAWNIRRWPHPDQPRNYLQAAYKAMAAGGQFFFIQLCLLAINGTNEIAILTFHQASDVVDYQVHYRAFSLFIVAASTLTLPLWSAIAQAQAEGQAVRVQSIVRFLRLSLVFTACGLAILTALFPWLLSLWIGGDVVQTNSLTSTLFAIYTFCVVMIMSEVCVANGFGRLRLQVISFTAAVLMKILLLFAYRIWVPSWDGLLLINIIVLVPVAIVLARDSSRTLRQFGKQQDLQPS
ncbi:MAG: hypothetical protein AAF270_01385 [Pseudomonadota bacterium]